MPPKPKPTTRAAQKSLLEPTTPSGFSSLEDETLIIRGVWYGDPGTRKTTAMATMANLGKVVVIDTENGLKIGPLKKHGVNVSNIMLIKSSDVTFTRLEDLIAQLMDDVALGDTNIIGVVWDSVTATYNRLTANVVTNAVEKSRRMGTERLSWKTHKEDYGDSVTQTKIILRGLRDQPVHLAISAHSRRDQDEDGFVRIAPSVSPALQSDLFAFSDIMVRMDLLQSDELVVGYGLTKPVGRFECKDRFDTLPSNMVSPTFERVHGYLTGGLTAENDEVQLRIAKLLQS